MIRVVRTVKALRKLRTMCFALLNSFTSLIWAFTMILMIIYVFSIIFASGVAGYFATVDVNDSEQMKTAAQVHASFGTLYEAIVSLFCAITGGNDWMAYGELLREIPHGEFYFLAFVFYIGF